MTDYFPEQTLIWFKEYILGSHKSNSYVPAASRGIRLVGENEALKPNYIYIGTGADIDECIEKIDTLSEPLCMLAAGPCMAITNGTAPNDIYLISIDLPLATLYNRVREFLHHYRIVESPSEQIHISKPFKQLIEDIIECRISDESEIQARLSSMKINIGKSFRLYVVEFEDDLSQSAIAWNFIISVLEEMFPSCIITMYGNNILLFEPNPKNETGFTPSEELLAFLEKYNCHLGIANLGYRLSSTSAMYSQAISATRYGTAIDPGAKCCTYEDYAMYQMVEFALDSCSRLMKTRNPMHLCNIEAVRLSRYDVNNGDNLLEILHCYLQHNCNISDTARDLFIHRNTLNNKIHKIEEIIGRKLEGSKFLDRLRFSCIVLDYQNKFLNKM